MQDKIKILNKLTKKELVDKIINQQYNDFISDCSDYKKDEEDKHGFGKRIPYIGWFWRNTDFANKKISIGDCGGFIGIMENNKWEYDERYMTDEECDILIGMIDKAMIESNKGGLLTEVIDNTNNELDKIWDYFQTLKI